MTAARFLVPTPVLAADRVRLDGPEGRHAAAVRRLRPGEPIDLTDGAGLVVCGMVAAAGPDWLDVAVHHRLEVPAPSPRLVVVQALAKGEASERAVAALVEVGADEIVPWPAARSVVRWQGERGERSWQRWRSTAREAAKQARRAWLPVVAEPCSSAEVAARIGAAVVAVVLHEAATAPITRLGLPAAGEVLVVVGPEGSISTEELSQFQAAGASVCRLGPTVLRTSTAGIAAAAVILAGCGRWDEGAVGSTAGPGGRRPWPKEQAVRYD